MSKDVFNRKGTGEPGLNNSYQNKTNSRFSYIIFLKLWHSSVALWFSLWYDEALCITHQLMLICGNVQCCHCGDKEWSWIVCRMYHQEETEQQAHQCLGTLFSMAKDPANSWNYILWDGRIKYSISWEAGGFAGSILQFTERKKNIKHHSHKMFWIKKKNSLNS